MENSNSIFYLINWIFAAETIGGQKLFKNENYSRKYSRISSIMENLAAYRLVDFLVISLETYDQYLEYLVSTTLGPIYFTGF